MSEDHHNHQETMAPKKSTSEVWQNVAMVLMGVLLSIGVSLGAWNLSVTSCNSTALVELKAMVNYGKEARVNNEIMNSRDHRDIREQLICLTTNFAQIENRLVSICWASSNVATRLEKLERTP